MKLLFIIGLLLLTQSAFANTIMSCAIDSSTKNIPPSMILAVMDYETSRPDPKSLLRLDSNIDDSTCAYYMKAGFVMENNFKGKYRNAIASWVGTPNKQDKRVELILRKTVMYGDYLWREEK